MHARPSASAVVVRPDTPLTMRGFGRNWVALDGTLIRLDVYICLRWPSGTHGCIEWSRHVGLCLLSLKLHTHTHSQRLSYTHRDVAKG